MADDAYERTLAWLYGLETQAGIDLKLERVRAACARLGHPERSAPVLHVAGTNGKGSTAAMAAAVLRADGRRVGLYTSPHLVSFRERIVVDGAPIAADAVVEGVARLRRDLGDDAGLTCFEMITLLAFVELAAQRVDAMVLEVGLGGRLDATNVVEPEVTIVTNVGLDHERFLGSDIASIAREKAGIVKPGIPVVSGAGGEAAAVVAATAARLGSPLHVLDEEFALGRDADGMLRYRSPVGTRGPLVLGLDGRHQWANAALAIRALEVTSTFRPSAAAVVAGLADVRWPGRLQLVRDAPAVVLDGAHNPAGVAVLLEGLRDLMAGRRVRVLFGVMADKVWQGMLTTLAEAAYEIVLTRPRQPRSADPAVLASAVADHPRVRIAPDPVAAYDDLVGRSAPEDVVVVTGSLFLVGDVLPAAEPALAAEAACERRAAALAGRP